jgi:predicted phage terminase large subunit-like protein
LARCSAPHGYATAKDKGSGTHLIQELKRIAGFYPIGIVPEKDKVTRMAAHAAKIEAGHVHLPERAPGWGTSTPSSWPFAFAGEREQLIRI